MYRAKRDPTQEVDSPVQSMRCGPFRRGHAWKRFYSVPHPRSPKRHVARSCPLLRTQTEARRVAAAWDQLWMSALRGRAAPPTVCERAVGQAHRREWRRDFNPQGGQRQERRGGREERAGGRNRLAEGTVQRIAVDRGRRFVDSLDDRCRCGRMRRKVDVGLRDVRLQGEE